MSFKEALRQQVVRALNAVWQVDPENGSSMIVPEELRGHVDSIQATSIPEAAANNIFSYLDEQKTNNTASAGLPLTLRLRSSSLIEDDWSARPTAHTPYPIIMLHGTGGSNDDFRDMIHELREDGWAVFAPMYGKRATLPVKDSAVQAGAYIDAVLQVTGAEKVIIIAHSQGGLVARYWIQFLHGAKKVKHFFSLAVPHKGTTMGGLASGFLKDNYSRGLMEYAAQLVFGPVVHELIVGSELITELNQQPLPSHIGLTCIASRTDLVIQPPETCFMETAENLWIQALDAGETVMHENVPGHHRVRQVIRNELRALAEG